MADYFLVIKQEINLDLLPDFKRHVSSYTREAVGFSNVGFAYKKGFRVLQDAKMKILEGEMVVILGKNGSGKTTLRNFCAVQSTPARRKNKAYGENHQQAEGQFLSWKSGFGHAKPESSALYGNSL